MINKIGLGILFFTIVLFNNLSIICAEDVWASSNKITGEWGHGLVHDYVVTDSIRGDKNKFTVNVKHIDDVSKNQISIEKYEFRQHNGLWCAYVNTTSSYVPISTHINDSVVAIFDICKKYSSFIRLSEKDIKAKEAKIYFDKGTNYYFDYKDYRKSADCFTNAINLYPQYYEAYIRRARALDKLGNYDKAIADYRYVIDSGNDEYNIARKELQDVLRKKRH